MPKGTSGSPPAAHPAIAIAALLAPTLPSLLAYNVSPSATLLNQCLALAAWGWLVVALAPASALARSTLTLQSALALVCSAALGSSAFGSLPWSLSLSAAGALVCAMVMVHAGATSAGRDDGPQIFGWVAAGMVLAGVLSTLIAVIQVFAPEWPDGDFIARSGLPGRAVGNLRQPNHLATLLLWAMIAASALIELRPLLWRWGAAVLVALLFGVLLSGSRTGAVGLLVLVGWALIDRGLSRRTRGLLIATPLLYLIGFEAMSIWAQQTHQVFGGEIRVGGDGADVSNSRFGIWSNTLALIASNRLTGVGFGEFNFAWTLSEFPGRPIAFFDHTHNLILNLAVELGLPLAALVLSLLFWALIQAWKSAAKATGDQAIAARAALVLVVMIGLHSQLEYPLWYTYFLLPAAWVWGYALGRANVTATSPIPARWNLGRIAGILIVMAAVAATIDYTRVVAIFEPPANAGPLSQRIAIGQTSPLFAYHADYAAATNGETEESSAKAFARAPHFLLDTRLMVAWAEDFERRGDSDRARWLAARLREFNNRDADEFFAVCKDGGAVAFQCQAPELHHDWREFSQVARAQAQAASTK
jgi:O-antigen ligase